MSSQSQGEKPQNGTATMVAETVDWRGAVGRPTGIVLPNQEQPVNHIALDIGGTLVKIVYYEAASSSSKTNGSGSSTGGSLQFIKFETTQIDQVIQFIREKQFKLTHSTVFATGGGAFKFAELFKAELGVTLQKRDELACLIRGLNFLLKHIDHESFTYRSGQHSPPLSSPKSYVSIADSRVFPYLVVNIGSGVSIIKVDSPESYERVSGSTIGGGAYAGLCRLLTPYQSFDEMMSASLNGNNVNVDMLVGDIYGRDYTSVGLTADTVAASFNKMSSDNVRKADPKDICASLLKMICNNIAQIAYLNAMRYDLHRIYFGGHFIADHPPTMAALTFGVNYWSKGTMKALFLLHEGYLGAMGAFLNEHDAAVTPVSLRKTYRGSAYSDEAPLRPSSSSPSPRDA